MNTLNLSVPEQHGYTDPTVEVDPARLVEWLSDLPLMNVSETVRLLYGALDSLNEQKLEHELRFRCLEVYRPAVAQLFETLDPLHIRQVSMSRKQRHETIAGAAHLFNSIAGGYKLIVLELQGRNVHGDADALLGKAIHRAVETLGYMLLDCYRFYRTVPPYLISELHQLYRAARHEGLLDINMPGEQEQACPTTAMLYKCSMLLSLTDPDRLAEGKVSLLADLLREHADKCRIVQGSSWTGTGAGLFLLDLGGGALPRFCTGLTPPIDASDPYLLETSGLLDAVRERLAHTPERIREQSPEAIVLQHLLPADRGAALRSEKRRQDGRWVSLLLGLEHIHAYLLELSGKRPAAIREADDDPADCRVLDSSESGMKLFWEEGGAGDARVGDLLGVVEVEADQQTTRLASIRSLRVLEQGGMEAGVQMVASGLGAVYCSMPDQPGEDSVQALFLPAEEQADIAATLVAAKGLYEEGRALLIDVGGREIRVRAGRLVSDSPVFDRFEFSAE